MYVITADQRRSRRSADAVVDILNSINSQRSADLVLPAERTAGDEIQMLIHTARATVEIALELTRTEQWSVGIGIGTISNLLGDTVRATDGHAFYSARTAVSLAKRIPARCAVRCDERSDLANEVQPFLELLIQLRTRRTGNGWELHDLLTSEITQVAAAKKLGISPQSASQRARVAGLDTEREAIFAISSLLRKIDNQISLQGEIS